MCVHSQSQYVWRAKVTKHESQLTHSQQAAGTSSAAGAGDETRFTDSQDAFTAGALSTFTPVQFTAPSPAVNAESCVPAGMSGAPRWHGTIHS